MTKDTEKIIFPCSNCKKPKELNKSQINQYKHWGQRNFFCDQKCAREYRIRTDGGSVWV